MRKAFLIPMLLGFLMLAGAVSASSTQQYNNIHLTPYYFSILPADTNQTMQVNINPPDSIASVVSVLFHFKVFTGGSTTNYALYVNSRLCGNYLVDTSFANSGQYEIAFDCTALITKSGNYTIKLKSDRNAGSFYGWLDLTYMNNPRPEMEIKGTEYAAGDVGTIFLQLKDADGKAVSNGNCYASVFYPNQPNSTHAKWLDAAPMMYLAGSKGLYYYDTVMPNITGVYMIEAECSYEFGAIWHYAPYDVDIKPIRTVVAGTFTGDTFILNDYEDSLYTQCASGTGKLCEAYYGYNVSGHNITSLDLYYLGESEVRNTLYFYVWNWTNSAWITLPNSLLFHATSGSGVDEFASNQIPSLSQTIAPNGTVRIRTYSLHTAAYNMFTNWLSLKVSVRGAVIQDVKGSGEIHISAGGANNTGAFADLEEAITSVNNTVKSEHTATNSLINYWGNHLNTTMNWWGNHLNATSNYWGTFLWTTMDFWGNALETKMDNIIMGNVTVTALVDYDEIALTTMQYLKALEKMELI